MALGQRGGGESVGGDGECPVSPAVKVVGALVMIGASSTTRVKACVTVPWLFLAVMVTV